jgi:hypothetical protein
MEKKISFSLTTTLLISLVSMLAVALGFLAYVEITESDSNTNKAEELTEVANDDSDDEVVTEEIPAATTTFVGDFLTVDLPDEWSLVEYEDGINDDNLTGMVTYTGLTGFEVLDETDTIAFAAHGAFGIGGIAFCENYYQFPDVSLTHYSDKADINIALGEAAPTIVDYTATTYAEYEVLGTNWRRIEDKFYWDEVSTGTAFEAACGPIAMMAPTYVGLSFDADGTDATAYFTEILLGTADTVKLELLDDILESLVVN